MTRDLVHSLDALAALPDIKLSAAFGPQHGLRGDKQDNMVESPDFLDPVHGIPVFSLYGEVRRPTAAMMDSFDVLLVDLQDVGCRIYTFITTLRYVLEAAAQHKKSVWVLDRPNPVGRPVEGLRLRAGWESFVGAGPLPMRHGLTLGELAHWFVRHVEARRRLPGRHDGRMESGRQLQATAGRSVNEVGSIPAPTRPICRWRAATPARSCSKARRSPKGAARRGRWSYSARRISTPRALLTKMESLAPEWLRGCRLRECWFEPTFHKHAGKLCAGIQIHVDDPSYDHEAFKPWRLMALAFKALRLLQPEYDLWRDFPYEYEKDRLAIDLINGGELLRRWVDDSATTSNDLDALARSDEKSWGEEQISVSDLSLKWSNSMAQSIG